MPVDDRPPKARTLTGYAPLEEAAAVANTLPAPPEGDGDPADGAPAPPGDLRLPRLDRARFEALGEVGRGGLGRVLKARDVYLDRHVAVKELLDHGAGPDEAATARFVREALITARLQHPAIVPIYDAGHTDGTDPFYTMKLVDGRSLAERLKEAATLEERLALLPAMIAVADAMAYAHNQRIIHRDLKPQNVLVGSFRETIIIDWGLAKDLAAPAADSISTAPGARAAASSSHTIAGSVMGTPAYMSPEQALGDEVDARTDVYALGAMLYHLVTGVVPREGRSIDEVLVKAATGEIVPIAEVEPRAPADLAAIVGKAMAPRPGDRYPTAQELAEDLHKFETGKLVGAHRYTRVERFTRWVRRNAAVVAVAGIAGAILVGYGAWSVREIVTEKRAAQTAAGEALAAKTEAERNAAAARTQTILVRARQYAASGHTAEEIALLRTLARPDAGPEARQLAIDNGLVWKAHQRLAMALGREVQRAFRSADGQRFIAVSGEDPRAAPSSSVRAPGLGSGSPLREAPAAGSLTASPYLVRAWDVATGAEVARLPLAPGDVVAAISPGGSYAAIAACDPPCTWSDGAIVSGGGDGVAVAIRELATAATPVRWTTPRLDATTFGFAPDDAALAYRRDDKLVVRELPSTTSTELDAARCPGPFAIAHRGKVVALSCGDDVEVVGSGRAVQRFRAPKAELAFVAPDALLVVAAQHAMLWDAAAGEVRGSGDLPAAARDLVKSPRDRDVAWTLRTPGATVKDVAELGEPRVTSGPPLLPRAAVTAPAVRGSRVVGAGLRIATFDGDPWRALALTPGDAMSIAMLDELVPPLQPAARCIARAGGELHALVPLDHGARLLVDEQEIATGLAQAPVAGYAQTTA
ncbi:MAG: serine/threonine protein kinase, partial [Deltaproteobacteria bacterium]|nr:serine/threonine protein kinase [Deltaproteobacteria bacterium]